MFLLRSFTGLGLCLLVSFSYANPYQPYPMPGPRVQQVSPADLLKQGIEQLTNYIGSRDEPNRPQLGAFLENTISPFFDFEYMARWAAGAEARHMTPQQGVELEQKLRRLFMAGMVEKLAEYRHGRVVFLRPVGNPRTGELVLRVLAYQQGSPYPQRLSFRMYRGPRGWKVYDVSANGQSALAYYRTQFAIEAQQKANPYYAGQPPMAYGNSPYQYRR